MTESKQIEDQACIVCGMEKGHSKHIGYFCGNMQCWMYVPPWERE